MLQGIFQVAGVTSIFPFLALAADPDRIYNSQIGRWFVSWLPEMSNNQLLAVAGVFAILMMFAANFVCVAAEYVRNRYAHDYGHWLRMRLLNQMLAQPYSYFTQHNSSVLFKKVYGDVMGYINGVLLPLLDTVARAFTCLLLIVTLLFVHLKIALIAATFLAVFYFAVFFALKKRRQHMSQEFKWAWRGSAHFLQQLLAGIKPVKVHEVERNFADRFATPSQKLAQHGPWVPILAQAPRHVIEPVAFAGMIGLVVYFNSVGRNMAALLPNMGVMALAGYKLLPAVQLVYGQLTKISTSLHSLEEVYEEFENTVAAHHELRTKAVEPLQWQQTLALDSVNFTYPQSNRPIFVDLNITIPKNATVAFVGPTGSGKSTIVDLLTCLHQPQSGKLLVDGQPIDGRSRSRFLASIGYVPQDVFLTDDTIAANIALGVGGSDINFKRLREAAETAQIHDFILNELEDGFETIVGERGVRLSGGQRQRIGLARALYREPSILIFDEATSALDTETEAKLMDAVYKLAGEKTIIMVAHRLSTVSGCDLIFALENGRVHISDYSELVKA
jgi:ATP-binding cassette subfamily C protein